MTQAEKRLERLKELSTEFAVEKESFDHLKNLVDEHKAEIKREFADLKIETLVIDVGEIKKEIKVSSYEKEGFNEIALLEVLKAIGKTNCIKTKEYVDMDILEDEIYNGRIKPQQLLKCKESTTITKISVKKVKTSAKKN